MADTPKAFALDAAEGVAVGIDDSSDDEKFNVTVVKNGAEVESHEGLTVDALAALDSDHFDVELVDPPAAPDDESE